MKVKCYFLSSADWRNQSVNNAIQQPSLFNQSALFSLRDVLPPTVIKVEIRGGEGSNSSRRQARNGGDQKGKQKAPKKKHKESQLNAQKLWD